MNIKNLKLIEYFKFKYFLIFLSSLLFFSIFVFFTKNFLQINGDVSNFIEYFWRLENDQIPHQDFRSAFGPSLAFFYFVGDFFNNFFFKKEINILDKFLISKVLFAFIFFKISFFLTSEIFRKNKHKFIFSIIVALYISSYIFTSRAFGYFSLQSATSFYNSFILSFYFIIILYIIYIFTNLKNFKYFNIEINYLSFLVGFILTILVFLKITAVILFLPIFLFFFICRNESFIKNIIFYFVIGILSYLLIILYFLTPEGLVLFLKENFNYLQIFLNKTSTYEQILTSKVIIKNIFINSILDVICLILFLFVNKYNNYKNKFFYSKIINLYLILIIYFIVSFFLQITSEQYPESNIGVLILILMFLYSLNNKLDHVRKIILRISLIFPIFIFYKNIFLPLLIVLQSSLGFNIFVDKNILFYDKYKNYNFIQKILYTENKLDLKFDNEEEFSELIKRKISVANIRKINHFGCALPLSYITNTIPPKHTNLYWHHNVTFNRNYHNLNLIDETEILVICDRKFEKLDFFYFKGRKKISDDILVLYK